MESTKIHVHYTRAHLNTDTLSTCLFFSSLVVAAVATHCPERPRVCAMQCNESNAVVDCGYDSDAYAVYMCASPSVIIMIIFSFENAHTEQYRMNSAEYQTIK